LHDKLFKGANVLNYNEIYPALQLKSVSQIFIFKFAAQLRNQLKIKYNGIY